MREIEFRGKCLDKGEWVEGGFYVSATGNSIIAHSNGWVPTYNNPDEGESTVFTFVDPKTVGQFVFRKDKNGVRLYEGDTLFDGGSTLFNIEYSVEDAAFVLVGVSDGEVERFDEYDFDRLELFGNIHDKKVK